ncbi:Vacuolar protein sorting-associated protein 4B [Dirofilaria immitis]|nr:Vacuolar protein sorting-associated protein 4B [Dirofilaria immitis]
MHLDEAQSEKQKDTIRQRCASYLDRAEKVKEYLKDVTAFCSIKKFCEKLTGTGIMDLLADLHKMFSGGDRKKAVKMMLLVRKGAIVMEKPNVSWDDIAGLEGAKEALKEAVILPIKFPQLFTGLRILWTQ